ncbi:MAG: hypothetical protein JWR83_513 [Aeromicrobium sp.]|jgi:hypothetical protein|nr:hypothetical protein [Aeromicrobium sp.]
MINEIELRLIGATAPSGEIAVKDLANVATALQELVLRIGREVVNTPGPGRSKHYVEEFSQLRLSSLEDGSTVLRFSKGPIDKLDLDLALLAEADDRFWEILGAISADQRPDWATELIAESAGKLVSALRGAARTAIVAAPSRGQVHIDSQSIHLDTWTAVHVTNDLMTTAGRLEKVDLRSHEFRLRDDVGHTVELRQVQNDADVAQLVGRWVVAEGTGVLNESGRLVALGEARVSSVVDPAAEFASNKIVSREEILASAPGPDPHGGIDLTDDEFAEFMKAIRS